MEEEPDLDLMLTGSNWKILTKQFLKIQVHTRGFLLCHKYLVRIKGSPL